MMQLQPHRNSYVAQVLHKVIIFITLACTQCWHSASSNLVDVIMLSSHMHATTQSSMLYGVLIYIANAGCTSTNIGWAWVVSTTLKVRVEFVNSPTHYALSPPTMHYPSTYYQPTINRGHNHLKQTVSNCIMENTKLHTACLDLDCRQCGG